MKNQPLLVWFGLLAIFTVLSWPADPFNLETTRVNIPPGASVKATQQTLQAKGILPRFSAFALTVRLLGLQNKIKAGEYSFAPADPLPAIISRLLHNETVPQAEIRVTFPEGSSIYKMGLALKETGYLHWAEFQGLVNEGITAQLRLRHWGIFKFIPSESLEGYLFPDTYHLFITASPETVAEAMVNRFEQVVVPFWLTAQKETKLTLHETLTLASIIEKEAQKPEERAVISSVFHNRLAKGMPLAADPTVKYALERPSKIVYLDQLSVRSPYNTYKRRGLPPGPICNPGLESIKAAVYPAQTNYFFFVAKPDGGHIFSKTWQEHQRARQTVVR
ncbi:MAG: endolytic transglycosylase MltG [Candidatus Margulisiibacteriota bacterium]